MLPRPTNTGGWRMKTFKLALIGLALLAARAQAADSLVPSLGAAGGYQTPQSGFAGPSVYVPSTGAVTGTGIVVGPARLHPGVTVSEGHDSNVNLMTGPGKLSSNFTLVEPQLILSRRLNATEHYDAYYKGAYAKYSSAGNYDYNDSFFGVDGTKAVTDRLRMSFKLEYQMGHDAANSYVATNAIERWTSPTAQFLVHYGTAESKGQLELEGDYKQQRYKDPLMQLYDIDESRLVGRFFLRLHPKTHGILEVATQQDRYPNYVGSNGTQERVTAGLQWDATAKTSGVAKIGMMHESVSGGGGGNSGLAWDAAITYKPRSYSQIKLEGSREYAEWANASNAYILTQGATLEWIQHWTYRIKSTAGLLNYRDQFLGSGRVDDRRGVSLKAEYAFGHQDIFHLGLQEILLDRSSNTPGFSFHEAITLLSLGVQL